MNGNPELHVEKMDMRWSVGVAGHGVREARFVRMLPESADYGQGRSNIALEDVCVCVGWGGGVASRLRPPSRPSGPGGVFWISSRRFCWRVAGSGGANGWRGTRLGWGGRKVAVERSRAYMFVYSS
jgi:hypothetical protein